MTLHSTGTSLFITTPIFASRSAGILRAPICMVRAIKVTSTHFIVAAIAVGFLFPLTNVQAVSACPKFSKNLSRGMKDVSSEGQVRELQTFLAALYAQKMDTLVTGFFGPLTQQYVSRFQQERGLPVVGTVGPLTRAKMVEYCASVSTTNSVANTAVKSETSATSTPAQAPSCAISTDKLSYLLKDTATLSWTTKYATRAAWQLTPTKNNFVMNGEEIALQGSTTIAANIEGYPYVVLGVEGPGGRSTCWQAVPTFAASTQCPAGTAGTYPFCSPTYVYPSQSSPAPTYNSPPPTPSTPIPSPQPPPTPVVPTPTEPLGTYVLYFNKAPHITVPNLTQAEANTTCQAQAFGIIASRIAVVQYSNNPGSGTRIECYWRGSLIYDNLPPDLPKMGE